MPGPEIDVDEIDSDRFGFDQHLTGARGGLWLLDIAQDFRTTDFGDFDCVHADYRPEVWSPA
jgi:hypothetical protein